MLCLTDILIGMHAGSVKGNDTCIDTWKTLKATLQYSYYFKFLFPSAVHCLK